MNDEHALSAQPAHTAQPHASVQPSSTDTRCCALRCDFAVAALRLLCAAARHVRKMDWRDPFLLNDQLTEDERVMRDATAA
jgi:hypothetical protein